MPIRVHELAKQMDITSRELLNCIDRLGIENKKAASNLSDDETQTVKNFFKKAGTKQEAAAKPAEKPAAEKASQTQRLASAPQKAENRPDTGTQGQGQPVQRSTEPPQGQGQQSQGQRPQGQQSQGQRPQGQGQRPQGQGQQGQGQRPQGQSQRPQGQGQQRPQGQGQRPQGQGQQGQGQRPQGQGQQGQGQRPQGQGQRPQGQGQRPQGQGQQGQGQRPQGQGQRPQGQGQRPQGQGQYRPQGNRPQGHGQQGQGQRPQGQGQYRPQGNRPQGQGQRPQGQRPAGQDGQKTGVFSADRSMISNNRDRNAGKGPGQDQKSGPRTNDNSRFNKNKPGGQKPGQNNNYGNKQKAKQPPQTKKMNKKEKRKQQLILQQQQEQQAMEEAKLRENDIKTIQIGKNITVKDLADRLGKNTSDIIKPLMKIGIMATINQEIDFYTASNIAESFDVIVEEADEIDIMEQAFAEEEDKEEDKKERPPVVVVMGHVDHGKTSLLDAIRHSRVTDSEAGGITQHIGAYTVAINDKPITFLDTPGHEAFTAMRMRGAQVTDIAILVVAADDGVMPQTIEAINHARAANVEIIVAINKIDKPSANPDRVKQELSEHGILTEDWGGETICVPVSAMQRTGIDQLLEMILLVAEMRELKANPNKNARGTIIEAQLDKGRGPVATVLVQEGTLNIGDPIVAGMAYGKIRAMMDDKGNKVKKAGPSIPVEVLGLSEVPMAGDMFYVAGSERQARQVAESIVAQGREDLIKTTPQKVSLDDLFTQIKEGSVKDLNIVLKADVQGSVEAVKNSLERLSNNEVRIRIIHGGVGAITESDVMLASASNAIIIGFNVRPEVSAKSVADEEKVDMRLYRIIYNAIEDITAAMKGMLDPIFEEKVIGHAEIRQLFKASGVGTIAGSYVTDGKFLRNSTVRVVRDGIVVFDGELGALKRFKDDVKEVNTGYECGILLHNFNDIKEGDKLEAYIMEEIKR